MPSCLRRRSRSRANPKSIVVSRPLESCKSGAPRKASLLRSRRNVESMTNRVSAIAKLPLVSGVEALHVLEEIDVRYPFVGALRIVTEVNLSLDKM
jgi:hypothetical protein